MGIDFKNRLKKCEEAWKTGKDKSPGVPDGIYTMKLQKAELKESQAGNLMVAREHVVIDGEYTGVVTRDNIVIEGVENGMYYLAKWIELMGYEAPAEVTEIDETVKTIEADAPCYIAEVKINGDYRNVRIKELVEGGEAASTPAAKPKAKATSAAPASEAGDVVPVETEVTFESEGKPYTGKVVRMAVEEGAPDQYIIESGEDMYQLERADFEVPEPAAAGSEEDNTELLAFASAHSLEGITDDMTAEAIKEIITTYEYKQDELTPEEVTLLEGLGATIVKPAPVAKKPAPKPLPKAAPAATKPAAKPSPKPAAAKKAPAKKK